MLTGHTISGGLNGVEFLVGVLLELFVVPRPVTLLLLLLRSFILFLRCSVGLVSSWARVVSILGSIRIRIRGVSTMDGMSLMFVTDREAPTSDFDRGGMLYGYTVRHGR